MPTTTTDIQNVDVLTGQQKELLKTITSQLSPELFNQFLGLLAGPEFQTGLDALTSQAAPLDDEKLRERFGRTVADPAKQRFQEEFIPLLQERFTAAGAGGGSQERLGLRTGAERVNTELARQQEAYYDTAQQRQLEAAKLIPGYVDSPLNAIQGITQTGLGTQGFQPVATQTTTTSPWENFLTGVGSGLGGGGGFDLSSLLPSFTKKGTV